MQSILLLLFSNLITFYFAITQHWDIRTLMLLYWFQSVTIGVFQFFKILSLKNFSTQNFKINGQPASSSDQAKKFTAFFFAAHYGIFHFVYLIFIITFLAGLSFGTSYTQNAINPFAKTGFLLNIIIYFANHLFSFIKNNHNDSQKQQNLGKVMFYPCQNHPHAPYYYFWRYVSIYWTKHHSSFYIHDFKDSFRYNNAQK